MYHITKILGILAITLLGCVISIVGSLSVGYIPVPVGVIVAGSAISMIYGFYLMWRMNPITVTSNNQQTSNHLYTELFVDMIIVELVIILAVGAIW